MRHRRRNPSPRTWLLIVGAVVAAGVGVFMLTESKALASPGGGGGGGGGGGPPLPGAKPGVAVRRAVVTTNDAPPAGDVFLRSSPDAPGIPGVGAEKGGIVTVLNPDVRGDGVWAEVDWEGGDRLPPARGFVRNAFLRPA